MKHITNSKNIQKRARSHRVFPIGPQTYRVLSGNPATQDGNYIVFILASGKAACTCPWGSYREYSACSHALAALAVHNHCYVSAWTNRADALRQKRAVRDSGDGAFLTFIPKVANVNPAYAC